MLIGRVFNTDTEPNDSVAEIKRKRPHAGVKMTGIYTNPQFE